MKKVMAMFLAAVAAASLTMTAFANDIKTDGIKLGKDDGMSLGGAFLQADELYRFPIILTENGEEVQLEKKNDSKYRITVEKNMGGQGLSYVKPITVDGKYYLDIRTDMGYTANHDHKYTVVYTEENTKHTASFSFSSGYRHGNIAGAVAGENVQVDNDAPLYTAAQLEKLSALNGYGKVTFAGEDWTYSANVSGMGDVNFTHNNQPIPEIVSMFSDSEMKFLSFPAGGSFKGSAELTVDLADFEEAFGDNVYAYRYLYGRLYKMPAVYSTDGTITLSVTNLGRYVITDRVIKEATIVDTNGGTKPSEPSIKPEVPPVTGDKPNPDTGR